MKLSSDISSPHIHAGNRVSRVMRQVLYALVPGILAHIWFFGFGIVVQIALAVSWALAFEAVSLKFRQRPLKPFLTDYSAVVTAVLFALSVSPLLPWWASMVGMFFAIVIAKHLYGGLGYNLFNPAMVAFAVVIIAFPLESTRWLPPGDLASNPPGFLTLLKAVFMEQLPAIMSWDSVTEATPLDLLKIGSASNQLIPEIQQAEVFGAFGGKGWEWIALAYLVGGLYLVWQRVADWRTPLALIGTVILISLPVWINDASLNPSPFSHIFSGGIMLAAFFIATDPVSGCTTSRGRWLFAAGVAILTLALRRWSIFPDGVAFAVLLMNIAAPLIDHYARPRAVGEKR